ncbi:MAG: hypothetical protein FWH50_02430 [Coriobacteriia bacterium]|nr:hypothetical protein [Coriobacteriia bacterium]
MFDRSTINRFRRSGVATYSHRSLGNPVASAGNGSRQRATGFIPRRRFSFMRLATIATSLVLVVVLLASGGILLYWRSPGEPGGRSQVTFDFGVAAYAETSDGGRIVQDLTDDSIALPSGRLFQGEGYEGGPDPGFYIHDAHWQVGSLLCSGEELDSVTFTAERGGFANFDNFNIHPKTWVGDDFLYNYVRHYNIDAETYATLTFWLATANNQAMADYIIRSGLLDDLIGIDLRDQFIAEPERFMMKCRKIDSNGMISVFDNSYSGYYPDTRYNPDLPQTYELLLTDMSAENDFVEVYDFSEHVLIGDFPQSSFYWELGQSVTVEPGQTVNYCPAFEILDSVAKSQGDPDYESFGSDIVYVSATSVSGQTLTKAIELSFDASGTLCARLLPSAEGAEGEGPGAGGDQEGSAGTGGEGPGAGDQESEGAIDLSGFIEALNERPDSVLSIYEGQSLVYQQGFGQPICSYQCFMNERISGGLDRIVISEYDSGKVIWTLKPPANVAGSAGSPTAIAYLIDVNFDGARDLLVPLRQDAAGISFHAYLWNPLTAQYDETDDFDGVWNPVMDFAGQRVLSLSTESQITTYAVYRFIDSELICTDSFVFYNTAYELDQATDPSESTIHCWETRDEYLAAEFFAPALYDAESGTTVFDPSSPEIAEYLQPGSFWELDSAKWSGRFYAIR